MRPLRTCEVSGQRAAGGLHHREGQAARLDVPESTGRKMNVAPFVEGAVDAL